jgi:hydroxymethylpyrimidine pyrophosphatase-like HAD family hydrolase
MELGLLTGFGSLALQVDANIISSGQGDWRYLDLVSNQAGKLESLEYVAKAEGFPLDRTVACGDSGNDILMLAGKNRAIVVGNAQDDLRRWVDQNPEAVAVREDGRSRLRVSEAHEAKGILEGLRYFGFRE